ncbi:MAG: HAD family hydrolase [Syntrophomonas sp.]
MCVFDLDGTLLNSLRDIANGTNYALEKNGFPKRKLEEYPYFVCDGLPALLKKALGEHFTPEASSLLVDDFNYYYNLHYADFTRPYAGISDLLDNLMGHGIHVAVLSNKPDHFVKMIVDKMYPDVDFSFVQGKSDLFPPKPDPASLLNILKELGTKPGETLYIGDSNVDVFTAKNAGIKIIGVTWGFRGKYELEEAGADYIVESPSDILKLV